MSRDALPILVVSAIPAILAPLMAQIEAFPGASLLPHIKEVGALAFSVWMIVYFQRRLDTANDRAAASQDKAYAALAQHATALDGLAQAIRAVATMRTAEMARHEKASE